MGLQQEFLAETAKFILTDDHIKKIIQHDGTNVDFWTGLSYDVASKLRDSHVIDLLSNPKHVHKQKVTHIASGNMDFSKSLTVFQFENHR